VLLGLVTFPSGIMVLFSPHSLAGRRDFYFRDLNILAILSVFVVSPNQTQVSPQTLRRPPPLPCKHELPGTLPPRDNYFIFYHSLTTHLPNFSTPAHPSHYIDKPLVLYSTAPGRKKSGNGDRASGALIGVFGVLEPIEQPCF